MTVDPNQQTQTFTGAQAVPGEGTETGGPPPLRSGGDAPLPALRQAGLPKIPEIELDQEIGRGGMGVVYRGRQPYLDRRVAVKVLNAAAAGPGGSTQFVERFRREAKILAGLAHPNIVACHQAGATSDGDCYLAMEFIDGPNLRDWIVREGPLHEAHALMVTRDVALALEYAHTQGIIHRDVKPENILLSRLETAPAGDSFPFSAKLVDLGLARPLEEGDMRLTAEGTVMGTPSTMAPEQFEDAKEVDYRADIYGLGCVLYHALVGEAAFPEKQLTQIVKRKCAGEVPDPRAIRKDLLPGLAALCRDMLSPGKKDRPSYNTIISACDSLMESVGSSPVMKPRAKKRKAAVPEGFIPGESTITTDDPPEAATQPASGASPTAYDVTQSVRKSSPAIAAAKVAEPPKSPVGKIILAAIVLAAAGGGAWYLRGSAPPPVPFVPGAGAVVPIERVKIDWGPQKPLISKDPNTALDSWGEPHGPSQWGADEEVKEAGVGTGTGTLPRALGRGPWRVEGKLKVIEDAELKVRTKEAGVRVDLEGGASVALVVKNLGLSLHLTVERNSGDGADGKPVREKVLISSSLATAGDLEWAISVDKERILFEVVKEPYQEVPLGPGMVPAGISMYVNQGAVRFRDLYQRRPNTK